jgi:hypothetical protein
MPTHSRVWLIRPRSPDDLTWIATEDPTGARWIALAEEPLDRHPLPRTEDPTPDTAILYAHALAHALALAHDYARARAYAHDYAHDYAYAHDHARARDYAYYTAEEITQED